MADVGYACLLVGMITMVYAAVASVYGARSGERQFVVSGRYALDFTHQFLPPKRTFLENRFNAALEA